MTSKFLKEFKDKWEAWNNPKLISPSSYVTTDHEYAYDHAQMWYTTELSC